MPPRIDPTSETRAIQLRAPAAWFADVDDWRRQQSEIPTVSESIRKLVSMALEAEKKRITKQP